MNYKVYKIRDENLPSWIDRIIFPDGKKGILCRSGNIQEEELKKLPLDIQKIIYGNIKTVGK
jgi:hypothetical protein